MGSLIFGLYHFKRDRITLYQPQVKERLEFHPCACGWRVICNEAGHRGQNPLAHSITAGRLAVVCQVTLRVGRKPACIPGLSLPGHPPTPGQRMPTLLSQTLMIMSLNFPF